MDRYCLKKQEIRVLVITVHDNVHQFSYFFHLKFSKKFMSVYYKQVLPKAIWEERVATPHDGEWTRPLRVLLAA